MTCKTGALCQQHGCGDEPRCWSAAQHLREPSKEEECSPDIDGYIVALLASHAALQSMPAASCALACSRANGKGSDQGVTIQPSGMASALTVLLAASASNFSATTTSLGSSSCTPRCLAAASRLLQHASVLRAFTASRVLVHTQVMA